jgi:hypothetical protein
MLLMSFVEKTVLRAFLAAVSKFVEDTSYPLLFSLLPKKTEQTHKAIHHA